MRFSCLLLVFLGNAAAVVSTYDSSISNEGEPSNKNTSLKQRLTVKAMPNSSVDHLDLSPGISIRAKAPAKPKTPTKPPATPPKPKSPPVQSAKPSNKPSQNLAPPAKPTKPAASSPARTSTLKTSTTSTPSTASASVAPSSSSLALACPIRPRKRSVEDLVELDSWMGFDAKRGRRYTVVVLG
jgi:outer membrane biosynthesis protein TonB